MFHTRTRDLNPMFSFSYNISRKCSAKPFKCFYGCLLLWDWCCYLQQVSLRSSSFTSADSLPFLNQLWLGSASGVPTILLKLLFSKEPTTSMLLKWLLNSHFSYYLSKSYLYHNWSPSFLKHILHLVSRTHTFMFFRTSLVTCLQAPLLIPSYIPNLLTLGTFRVKSLELCSSLSTPTPIVTASALMISSTICRLPDDI